MASVFVAYSSKDMRFLTELRSELRRRSAHEVFVAEFSLQPGQEWRQQVEANLNRAEFFVPLISKGFLGSPEARRELSGAIELADEKKLTIVPVIIETLDRAELPLIVKATQYIRFQPMDSMINVLLRALDPSAEPLVSRSRLEEFVASRNLAPDQLVELANQVYDCSWSQRGDKSKAIKFIADRLRNQGHVSEALGLYDLTIQLYPRNASLRVTRAQLYGQLDNYQAAENDCAFILEEDPNNPWVLMQGFWTNHAWALSKSTIAEATDQVAILETLSESLAQQPRFNRSAFLGFIPASFGGRGNNAHTRIRGRRHGTYYEQTRRP